jgi:hypothetical protein
LFQDLFGLAFYDVISADYYRNVSRVEAGWNTSTVALRVVEGHENNVVPGVKLDHLVTETWSSRLGVGRKAYDLAL